MGLLPVLVGGCCLLGVGLFVSGGLFFWGRAVAAKLGGRWRYVAWLPVIGWLLGAGGSVGGWILSAVTMSRVVGSVWSATFLPSAVLSVASTSRA